MWCSLASAATMAGSYVTSWDKAQWSVNGGQLSCALTHPIEGFGEARLSRSAGGGDQLVLTGRNGLLERGEYQIASRPPAWIQDGYGKPISRGHAKQGITLAGDDLRTLIAQLDRNLFVDFSRVEVDPNLISPRYFSVSLTPRNFKKAYGDYLACINKMVPFSFAQISKLTYQYSKEAIDLSQTVRQHLDKILRYSAADGRVLGVIIDAHSHKDSTDDISQFYAQNQADLVADYLQSNGYGEDKIISRVHGDKFPIASNLTEAGQAKNRRVTIRLEDQRLRDQRTQRIQARQKAQELEEQRLAQQQAQEVELAKQREEAQASYIKTAKEAMKPAQPVEKVQVIRKSKPGITLDELRSLVEDQDLSNPTQPRIEIRMD